VLFTKVREIAPQPGKPGETRTLKGWRDLPRSFYMFVLVVVLFALGNSSDMFLLLYGYEKFGLGLVQIITLWIVLHLSKIFFSLPGGLLSDKLGRRPVIIAGWLVYALVYLGMAQAQQQWQFWALFVVYGFYYGMTEGAEKALVTDFVPSENRGTAFGVYHSAVGFAALPASLLFGIFWNEIGPQWAFGIGAALAGAAAIGLMLLLSTAKKPMAAD
jgi:MFS family permease